MKHTDPVFLNSLRAEARKIDFPSADVHAGKARGMIASQEEENGVRIPLLRSRALTQETKYQCMTSTLSQKYIRNNNGQTV